MVEIKWLPFCRRHFHIHFANFHHIFFNCLFIISLKFVPKRIIHDDVIKWNIFRVTGHLCGEFTGPRVNSPHKGQCRETLIFTLICAQINGKQSRGWWFETPSRPLWRLRNVKNMQTMVLKIAWRQDWPGGRISEGQAIEDKFCLIFDSYSYL